MSLTGHALEENKIVQFIYLDDAGISNPSEEPFVVIAGPLVNADKQWLALEQHLEAMADEYAPPDKRKDFSFHAMDLHHGTGHFPREKWDKEARWKIIDELIGAIRSFKLPVAAGWVERTKLAAHQPSLSVSELTLNAQIVAFAICSYGADLYLLQGVDIEPGEVGSIVFENNNKSRKRIKEFHRFNRDPKNADLLRRMNYGPMVVQRIVGNPHFEEKGQTSPLQLADICAYVIKRHLMGKPESDRFYEALKPGMVLLARNELASGAGG